MWLQTKLPACDIFTLKYSFTGAEIGIGSHMEFPTTQKFQNPSEMKQFFHAAFLFDIGNFF